MEEGTNFQENNCKVVSVISSKEIQVFPAEASMCVSPELRPCITEPVTACDGLVERLNSTLCQTLSMFVSKHQKDWDTFIPDALLAIRTSPSESTGESLFYSLYGREPLLPMDVSLLPPSYPASSNEEHRRKIVKQIELAQ